MTRVVSPFGDQTLKVISVTDQKTESWYPVVKVSYSRKRDPNCEP